MSTDSVPEDVVESPGEKSPSTTAYQSSGKTIHSYDSREKKYDQAWLSSAAQNGDKATVQLLLTTSQVDVDFKGNYSQTPLSYAAANGHEPIVQLLLATGKVDANSKDDSGHTPLLYAAANGHEPIVQLLLATGQVDADSKDHSSRTPLSWAAANGHEPIVQLLLATGHVNVDSKDNYSQTPLSYAAANGHEPIVQLLLATGHVNVDSKDNYSQTPLSHAAANGHESIVQLLLTTSQVDANSRDHNGQTPLLWAAENGHESIVQLLLATSHIDVDSKEYGSGQTPLSYAAKNGHEAIVQLLLTTGHVDVNSKNNYGQTPLSHAAANGHESIVQLLLATGHVDVNSKNNYGQTPLSHAAANGHESIVQLLLATSHVDVNSKDDSGQTPLSYAAKNGHEAVVQLLLATGHVDADSKDSDSRTPLSWAAENGHKAVIQLLLTTSRVDVNSKDDSGQTPLSHAAANGHESIVQLLLATGQVDAEASSKLHNKYILLTSSSLSQQRFSGVSAIEAWHTESEPSYESFSQGLVNNEPLSVEESTDQRKNRMKSVLFNFDEIMQQDSRSFQEYPSQRETKVEPNYRTRSRVQRVFSFRTRRRQASATSQNIRSTIEGSRDPIHTESSNDLMNMCPEEGQESATGLEQNEDELPDVYDNDQRISQPTEYLRKLDHLAQRVYENSALKALKSTGNVLPVAHELPSHHFEGPLKRQKAAYDKARASLSQNLALLKGIESNAIYLKEQGFSNDYISLLVLDHAGNRANQVAKLTRIQNSCFGEIRGCFERALDALISSDTLLQDRDLELPQALVDLHRACENILFATHLTKLSDRAPIQKTIESNLELLSLEWNYAVQILDLALLSYSGAHVADLDRDLSKGVKKRRFEIPYSSEESMEDSVDYYLVSKMYMTRRHLCCLEALLGQQVWVLSLRPPRDDDKPLYLSTEVGTIADIWGPLWKSCRLSRPEDIYELRIGNGCILPWIPDSGVIQDGLLNEDEIFCHWISTRKLPANIELIQKGLSRQSFILTDQLFIGATGNEHHELKPNPTCTRSNDDIKRYMNEIHGLHQLNTARQTRYKDAQTVQVQGGGLGLTVGTTLTYKRREGHTWKDALVERWRDPKLRNPVPLEHYTGLMISSCTKNAKRVRLLDVLATDTMKIFLKGISFPWEEGLESRYYRALKGPKSFRRLWDDVRARANIGDAISICLDALAETGVDDQTGELRALWAIKANEVESDGSQSPALEPAESESGRMSVDGSPALDWEPTEEYTLSIFRKEHTWTRFLRDTPDVMTLAVVEDICLEPNQSYGRHCAAWRFDESGREIRTEGGFPILQTRIQINERLLTETRSQSLRIVDCVSQRPCWDLTGIKPGFQFLMGEQGVLEVIEDPKTAKAKLKGKGKETTAESSISRISRPSLLVQWYGVKSTTIQETRDFEIKQTFYGENPREHHTEYLSTGWQTKPIQVFILSDSSKAI